MYRNSVLVSKEREVCIPIQCLSHNAAVSLCDTVHAVPVSQRSPVPFSQQTFGADVHDFEVTVTELAPLKAR